MRPYPSGKNRRRITTNKSSSRPCSNHRTLWHQQFWISALECKQTTETMRQDDNADVKAVFSKSSLNTAFTMARCNSREPYSSTQVIIAQCTSLVQSWRTCFSFTLQNMRRNGYSSQLIQRQKTWQLLQPLRDHSTNRMITVHKNKAIWMPCKQ